MSIGIIGVGNMGRSIATQLTKTGEGETLADRFHIANFKFK